MTGAYRFVRLVAAASTIFALTFPGTVAAGTQECLGTGAYDSRAPAGWMVLRDPQVDTATEYYSYPFLKPPARIQFSSPVIIEGRAGAVTDLPYESESLKLAFRPVNGDRSGFFLTITDTAGICVIHPIDLALPPTDADRTNPPESDRGDLRQAAGLLAWIAGAAFWWRRSVRRRGSIDTAGSPIR